MAPLRNGRSAPSPPDPAHSGGNRADPGAGARYTRRLRQLAEIELEEAEAAELWDEVERHRCDLERRLGRDVGACVALLDLLVSSRRPSLTEPSVDALEDIEVLRPCARVDALTGLADRHQFEVGLERELERCRRFAKRSALLLLDLDRFQEINDEHGRPVGDEVLRRAGRVIRENIRGIDLPCRVCGDEFAVIVADIAPGDAAALGQRILRSLVGEFSGRTVGGRRLVISASGGIACSNGTIRTTAEWIAWADRALYRAKRRARAEREGATSPGDDLR